MKTLARAMLALVVVASAHSLSTRPPVYTRGAPREGGRGRGRGRGRGGNFRGGRGGGSNFRLPTEGLLIQPAPWWTSPVDFSVESASSEELVMELARRSIQDPGVDENRRELLETSAALFSLDDNAPSFRAAVITPTDKVAPPCFPSTYESE